jgi:hypothetical protein
VCSHQAARKGGFFIVFDLSALAAMLAQDRQESIIPESRSEIMNRARMCYAAPQL